MPNSLRIAAYLMAACHLLCASPEHYELTNGKVRLVVTAEGRVRELSNVQTGHSYLGAHGRVPWRMFYKTGSYKTGEAINLEIPAERQVCRVQREGNGLSLTYSRLKANLAMRGQTRDFDLRLVLRVSLEDDRLVWKATIDNRENGVEITEIWLPWLDGIGDLGLGPPADVLYWPEFAGRRIPNPYERLTAKTSSWEPPALRATYPWPASMQWFTFNNGEEGLSFTSEDKTLLNTCLQVTATQETGLSATVIKYPFVKAGESWTSEPVVVRLYLGDWHEAARAYKAWADTWMRRPDAPAWIRGTPGWAHPSRGTKQQTGAITGPYSEYPEMLKQARTIGTDVLMVFGWAKQGFDNRYPEYDVDETMGGAEGLRQALAQVKQAGGRTILYTQGHLIDPATDFYRSKGQRMTARDIWGAEYRERYVQASQGTLLKAMYSKWFAVACPSAPGWSDQLVSQFDLVHSFGAQGMLFDQMGGQPPYMCFSDEHGHTRPSLASGPGKLANYRRLREAMKKQDPDFAFVVELLVDAYSGWVDIIHSYGAGVYPGQDCFGELFRYTFPQAIITNRVPIGERIDSRQVYGHAFSLGLRFDASTGDGREAQVGQYLARLAALRTSYADLLLEGRFADNEGFVCSNNRVSAHSFVAGNRMAVVLWNPGETAQQFQVLAPGYTLESASWQNPVWMGTGHSLLPGDVAVLVWRRAAQ